MKIFLLAFFIFSICSANAQLLSSQKWIDDDLTIPFGQNGGTRPIASGVRFVYEPQWGNVGSKGDNRIKVQQFSSLPKFALEINLYKGWASIQGFYVAPSQIEFDDQSPVLTENIVITSDHKVDVDYGLGVAVSLFDGIVVIGTGKLHFDGRDFNKNHASFKSGMLESSFTYVNIQPVSAFRKVIKSIKIATRTPGRQNIRALF